MPSPCPRALVALLAFALACTPARRGDDEEENGDCGNGKVDTGETCDSAIESGAGACPTTCDDGDPCTTDARGGSADECSAKCVNTPKTDDPACQPKCGNGKKEAGEACDGDCPTTCADADPCTTDTLTGSAAECSATCTHARNTTDPACQTKCGNGTVDSGETCDGNCPTSCADDDPCTLDTLTGSAASCNAVCTHPLDTTDPSCRSRCGNGTIDSGETCDGNCPTSCTDNDPCTNDVLAGSAAQCTATCTHPRIPGCGDPPRCGNGVVDSGETCDPAITQGAGRCPTTCAGATCMLGVLVGSADQCNAVCETRSVTACTTGDGCCPTGCARPADLDCAPENKCGNGLLDAGEACDPGIAQGRAGACPTSCNDGDSCTAESLQGNPMYCSAACVVTPVTSCNAGDGCCPNGCTGPGDSDCPLAPNPYVGKACVDDSVCGSGGFCGTEASSGYTGGYCSRDCTSDADCGGGGHCNLDESGAEGACYKSCTFNSDCGRSGYECFDRAGDSRKECGPIGTGALGVGAACTSTSQCAGGQTAWCLTQRRGFLGGFCTRFCDSAACPAGSHCLSDSAICVPDCTSTSTCRPGYECFDADGTAPNECYPSGTGARLVGAPCETVSECAGSTDAVCASAWPDGMCLLDCSVNACPANTSCTTFQDGAKYCLPHCTGTGAGSCRAGYQCGAIADDFLQTVCYR